MKSHCRRGHPLTEDNVYLHPTTNAKICRQCRRDYVNRCKAKPLVMIGPTRRREALAIVEQAIRELL